MYTIDQVDRQALRNLIDSALELDIDLAPLLRQADIGCSVRELRTSAAIPFADYLCLQRALNATIRKTVHQRVGKYALAPDESEVMFHYMLGADDLAGALARMKFFSAMLGERIGDGSIRLSIEPPLLARLYVRIGMDPALHQQFAAFFLWEQFKLIEVLAWLIGQPIELAKIDLPFAPTPAIEQLIGRLRCPINYGATGYGLYFPKALLQKPVVRTLAELKNFLKMFGAVFISEEHFNRPPLSQRIERILEQQSLDHGSMPSASELANALNMSEATMRRHLQEGGSSFSTIKKACRLRLSKKLLALPNQNVVDIAQQLGYQDVNAFRRAFRQLSGHTPEGYRKEIRG
jgi:AraC-like DNA-binding protein